ncbi:MAG: nucleotide sugar dehydrogenase [Candidatus Babeliales bacterium]
MKKVCVIGLGYIGLPTSLIAAEYGFDVIGFDVDQDRVARINIADPVIEEPEIKEKLKNILAKKKFHATTKIQEADYFIIAVPTPFLKDKKADLSYVWDAVDSISLVLKKGAVVILESTVPVGATAQLAQKLEQKTLLKAGIDFFVAHCPERVLPGNIFHELVHNPRIIGGINEESVDQTKEFYKKFVKASLYLTNATTAEMVKLVENSSRDVSIAFANQIAAMAYKAGLNPFEVIELANKHPRVDILNPSCGVGGHCIAVDPWFLIETFPEQTQLLKAAREINDLKPLQVVKATKKSVEEWKKDNKNHMPCKVLILGLTYKPNIDDLRESPALQIAKQLSQDTDIDLLICEPFVKNETINTLFGKYSISFKEGLEQSNIILCLVNHTPFKIINSATISNKMILDYCGLLYKPHIKNQDQEQLFWPASTVSIKPIIDHVQGDL